MNKSLYYILLLLVSFAGLTSCKDDLLYNADEIFDGETQVDATIFFERFAPANLGQSRSDGDAIKEIKNLCILLYRDGKLAHSFYGTVGANGGVNGTDITGTVDQTGNSDRPSDGETSAEKKTPSARLKFTLPSGKYKMFAVANMGDIATTLGEGSELESLLNYKLEWQDNGVDNNYSISRNSNNQMLGYFSAEGSAYSFDKAPEITFGVNPVKNLYCWLRRAASKVTVSFDATDLEANVRIYLKSVQIRDIPVNCPLGNRNTPPNTYPDEKAKIKDGEIIYYCNEPDKDQPTNLDGDGWPVITRGHLYGLLAPGSEEKETYSNSDYHTELTPALYFYENMQGIHENNDKRQDADQDGSLDFPGLPADDTYRKKDGIDYGTYIEVVAYYNRLGDKGKIIYRFMLGKNETTDYNAERNFHYKLTLKFNGYANDVDWHIEYEQEKEIVAPDPYYISYLYNDCVLLPIRISGSDFDGCKLTLSIDKNDWYPLSVIKNKDTGEFVETALPSAKGKETEGVYYSDVLSDGPWYGFLSLAPNYRPQDDSEASDGIKVIGAGKSYNDNDWFQTIWHEKKNGIEIMNKRVITDFSPGEHADKNQGSYTVEKTSNGIIVHVPYYTRQKQIMPVSGYTGNNPYVAYRRKAIVNLKLEKGDAPVSNQDVTVYQVRRCVNPKGIWRSWDNDEEFKVRMMILPNENSDKFEVYESDGPWRAYVEVGADWIKLNGKLNGTVEGEIDSEMVFTYQPIGKLSASDKVRYGIICVEYNNYTCKHKIFVRQGYAPIEMSEGSNKKIKWHTCNLYSETEETLSPLEEGSLFKFGNLSQGILASNNSKYPFQTNVGDGEFDLSNNTTAKWSGIKAATGYDGTYAATVKDNPDANRDKKLGTHDYSFAKPTITNVMGYSSSANCRVATAEDFSILINDPDRQYGYGVLYGDGATDTAEDVATVYGYKRADGTSSEKGMRGCFVYNSKTGAQLFFPIGAEGHGKRKSNTVWYGDGINGSAGALQYAWRNKLYNLGNNADQLKKRPLFFDVYRRPGAIYWLGQLERTATRRSSPQLDKDDKPIAGTIQYTYSWNLLTENLYVDINYFSFEFKVCGTEAIKGTIGSTPTSQETGDSSACLIRLVEDVK